MEANDIHDITKLSFDGDFDQQVEEIMQYVRLTRQEVENLQRLLDDLHREFNGVWPGCKVYGFGSIVTGLGIKTSDLDCYVELPRWLSPPEVSFVLKASKVLRRRHWIFQQLFAITTAKVPIIKFYHAPTHRSCDVSFSNSAGVRNSQLITYFLEIDKKILYLAILIKYWAKIHKLTGLNLMSNYCLALLVIFYLQQRNILPSVIDIQKGVNENLVANWNMAFQKVKVDSLNVSLYELLGGFFKYYTSFKYSSFIICPYIGKPIERQLFLKIDTVPTEFVNYETNIESNLSKPLRLDTFMCVQDPFEHSRNCAVAVHPKLAQNIISLFGTAAELIETKNQSSYLKHLLETKDNKPIISRKPKPKPRISNGVMKQHTPKQKLKQNVKSVINNFFKAKHIN